MDLKQVEGNDFKAHKQGQIDKKLSEIVLDYSPANLEVLRLGQDFPYLDIKQSIGRVS